MRVRCITLRYLYITWRHSLLVGVRYDKSSFRSAQKRVGADAVMAVAMGLDVVLPGAAVASGKV